jgi:hypothetical protein
MPSRWPIIAASLAGLCTGVAAGAQVVPEPDAAEVARTPLRDLNIDARDIPEVLQQAARDPYSIAGMHSCNALVSEIARLDMVLGADYDIAEATGEKRLSEGRIGQSIVGSIIPFRGIVREATGAARADRTLRAAYTAGMARRAFLKGWGLGRGCAYPARPKPEEQ